MSLLTGSGLTWGVKGRNLIHNVTLGVGPAEMLGILGPNGAGKTTLLHLLAGLRRPDAGIVRLDGRPLRDWPRRAAAQNLALVEQTFAIHDDLTVEEAVRLGRTPYRGAFTPLTATDRWQIERALRLTGIASLRDRGWHTLSGGEQQRTQVARALAQRPRVVLLDEPTNHLDIRYQLEVLELLKGLGAAVIVALHDLNLAARFCDRVAVLKDGELQAEGSARQVLTPALLRTVFDVQAAIDPSPYTGAPTVSYLGVARG